MAVGLWAILLAVAGTFSAIGWGQTDAPQGGRAPDNVPDQVLDRVIAVVNNQAILASDLDLELRIRRLLPLSKAQEQTPAQALRRLTTRALIEQQIAQEDPHGMDVSSKELEDSLAELRQTLPDCKQRDCATAAGWAKYLASIGLEPEPVAQYWRSRIAVLRFIEQRFRSGIRVSPEEIATYYRETLVPQYAKAADAPPLPKISQRIEEILLQQRLNGMMNDRLKSLQDQGEVEILDPTLREAAAAASGEASASETGGKVAGRSKTGEVR